jgi:hypothetical protein
MKTQTFVPLRYHLLVYRREQLWAPAGLWALMVILILIMRRDAQVAYNLANAFLGYLLPLLAGILAAGAVVDDPGLELQLAAPRVPWLLLLERLALLVGIEVVAALAFQLFLAAAGVSLAPLGNLAVRQLVWLVPSLTFLGVGSVAALGFTQSTGGAVVAGALWIGALLVRDWFVVNRIAHYFYPFMAAWHPRDPLLPAIQAVCTGLGVLLIFLSTQMIKREERLI